MWNCTPETVAEWVLKDRISLPSAQLFIHISMDSGILSSFWGLPLPLVIYFDDQIHLIFLIQDAAYGCYAVPDGGPVTQVVQEFTSSQGL